MLQWLPGANQNKFPIPQHGLRCLLPGGPKFFGSADLHDPLFPSFFFFTNFFKHKIPEKNLIELINEIWLKGLKFQQEINSLPVLYNNYVTKGVFNLSPFSNKSETVIPFDAM